MSKFLEKAMIQDSISNQGIGSITAEKPSDMRTALNTLEETLSRLQDKLRLLDDRLMPIRRTRPQNPVSAKECGRPPMAPLADQIMVQAGIVEDIISWANIVLEEIEL